MITAWTESRVTELRMRWLYGESGGEIAAAMHVTRNTILGKANRLGLPERAPRGFKMAPRQSKRERDDRRNERERRVRALRGLSRQPKPKATPRASLPPLDPIPAPTSLHLELTSLKYRSGCRWFEGDPKIIKDGFCGNKGYPFCAHHYVLAYRPRKEREPLACP